MEPEELYKEFEKLDDKQKIMFINMLNQYKEFKKLSDLKVKRDIADELSKFTNEKGEPWLNMDWIKKNILKID